MVIRVEAPSKDIRSEMIKAQPQPPVEPSPVVLMHGHVTVVAPGGTRPGPMKSLARDLHRVFREHSCRGKWEAVFDYKHVSPKDRGRG